MLINLKRIGALSKLNAEQTAWIKDNHVTAAVEAGKIGGDYYAYPVSADNGYFMYLNKEAFEGTNVWDATSDNLKAGYTFQDLYAALDQKGGKWANGKVTWAIGDAWYVSGAFFGAGTDYSVTYNDKGEQTEAKCNFGYDVVDGKEDYTKGLEAVEAIKSTFMNADGSINKHFLYSDGGTEPLNDNITKYLNSEETPLAAAVCGTWKSSEIKGGLLDTTGQPINKGWGENARATVLPILEGAKDDYLFKTFAGFKLMAVNPYSNFAQQSEEHVAALHTLAKYLSDDYVSMERFASTALGPSNIKAQKNEEVAIDYALTALNEQYALDNNNGFRVQESVPANYWTPLEVFGKGLYNAMKDGTKGAFDTEANIKRTLKQLQFDIESAAQ